MKPPKLKMMVASTIYGFEDQLEQICLTLHGLGYDVWNSHMRTIPINPKLSNVANCLNAVKQCDLFFGIIRNQYGTGMAGQLSITHLEMLQAIQLNKPRWFIAHHDVGVARLLLYPYMYNEQGEINNAFTFKVTSVLDDIRVINLYNDTMMSNVPVQQRVGHWVDEFYRIHDIITCINTQFNNMKRIRKIVSDMQRQNTQQQLIPPNSSLL